jgi:hypothetical protein
VAKRSRQHTEGAVNHRKGHKTIRKYNTEVGRWCCCHLNPALTDDKVTKFERRWPDAYCKLRGGGAAGAAGAGAFFNDVGSGRLCG